MSGLIRSFLYRNIKINIMTLVAIVFLMISCIPMWISLSRSKAALDATRINAERFKTTLQEFVLAHKGNRNTYEILSRHNLRFVDGEIKVKTHNEKE